MKLSSCSKLVCFVILNIGLLVTANRANSILPASASLITTQLSNPKNSGATVYPYEFTGMQGTLVRLNVKLAYSLSGASPVSLKSKTIYFEISLNGIWQRIDEDGITTTSTLTNTSGLGENYYIIPDNLAKGTYDLRAVFSGDSEYAASLLTGKLTVNEPVSELISIPNDNSGYTGERVALILVHGDGVDEDTSQPLNRWDTFINFITQNKSLFKEFDIYRWRHTTAIPIGFNGTTGNAKQLAKDLAILGNKKIIFVAHSQGGLICRSFMNSSNPQTNVLGLITLATPHHGSPFAVPDWDGIMWARKVGTSGLSGGNLFNELIVSQTTSGTLSSILGLSDFTYDRMGSLNLAWDNQDEAINLNGNASFPLATFSSPTGFVELSSNDFNTISNPSVIDQTILYSAEAKNQFGTLKRLNETEKFKDKIITYGCFDDNLSDNRSFGELLVIFSFFSEHDQLKIVTKFLSDFGEIANPGRTYYANDGLVPLQSALFLDISGGTQFSTNVSGVVQSNASVESKRQVKLQRIFYGSRDGIRDHLDLLDASLTNANTLNYWNTLANDIRSFLPVTDNIPPVVLYNTARGQSFSSNSALDIDFTDNIALNNIWYQIDSNSDLNSSNWHLLTGDGINTLSGSQNNSGTSLLTDWKISDTDWGALAHGIHALYFKVTDDAGNTYITPDQATAFSFEKMNSAPTKPVLITPVSNEIQDESMPIIFRWSASTDADNDPLVYRIHILGNGKDTTINNIPLNTYTLPAKILNKASVYSYNITVSDGMLENVSQDGTINTTPNQMTPGEISFISPVNNADNVEYSSVQYAWTSSLNAKIYQLQIAADQNFGQNIKDLTVTRRDTSITLNGNRTYYNRVRGKNGDIYGPWSAILLFGTKDNPPSGFQYLSPTMDQEVSLDKGDILIETTIPTDVDNDLVTKKIHLTGTGLDTLIQIDATVRICSVETAKLKPNTQYRINSEVSDGKLSTVVPELRFKTAVNTAIGEVKLSDLVRIYPNPTQDVVYVEFQPTNPVFITIDIYDITRKLIEQHSEQAYESFRKTLDLGKLPAGTYLIRIILKENGGNTQQRTIKIIKY